MSLGYNKITVNKISLWPMHRVRGGYAGSGLHEPLQSRTAATYDGRSALATDGGSALKPAQDSGSLAYTGLTDPGAPPSNDAKEDAGLGARPW